MKPPRQSAGSRSASIVHLGEVAARFPVIEIACSRCGRRGRLRTTRLLAEHGPRLPIPDLLRIVAADCPRLDDPRWTERRGVRCPTLVDELWTWVAGIGHPRSRV